MWIRRRRHSRGQVSLQPERQRRQNAGAFLEPPLTSEEARQQAQAEGLTLRVTDNSTGYFGVCLDRPGKPKPFAAQVRRVGKMVSLGTFATAEEAALHVARSPEGRAAEQAAAAKAITAAVPPPTSEEARQQAQVEGLTLLVAESPTGFFGVHHKPGRSKPYAAQVKRGGKKQVHLGYFVTAEEAALCIARSPEGRATARKRATAVLPPSTSEVEVKDEPVQSGATHEEVPPMPPGAFVKEEEEEVIPSMPPGARWGVEVKDPMPMPSDATVKQEDDIVNTDRPTKRTRE